MVFNSEWLGELGTEGMIRLASNYTVARMLERDDFKNALPITNLSQFTNLFTHYYKVMILLR
ncbi:tyrosyl-tRNA synthetase [Actinobacillus equuli]|nr:tyrosyl-tRNA synthetase [Actinobacillus equuli]